MMNSRDIPFIIFDICMMLYSVYRIIVGIATGENLLTFYGSLIAGGLYLLYWINKKQKR